MRSLSAAGLTAAVFFAAIGAADTAEIKILSGSAIESVMAELLPRFEQSSGHKVKFDFNGAIGAMTERIQKGEAADVIIVSGPQVDVLEKEGKVVKGSRADFAKVGVGIFVRKGASKPDIGTIEAFKRTLLTAKSIGYNDPAAGAPVSIYLMALFQRLGIAEEMKAKTTVFKQRSERFEAVARGDVEIGFNQISEIVVMPSVDLVGPLPAEIQNYTLFTAAVVATSNEQEAARSLIRFIASPAAAAAVKSKGFEPTF